MTDAAGRAGVAVTRTEAGSREELVFDPIAYKYPGHNIIAVKLDLTSAKVVPLPRAGAPPGSPGWGPNPKPGDVIYMSALLRVAIVGKAGRRP